MSDTKNKFYLTTPIYYVNARPHIGHAYTTIAADVIARRHRLLGDDTFFLTGTDEHGQKIERSAAAAGIPPQQFADEVSASFQKLWQRMGITNDAYIRTTDDHHKRGVQKLFSLLQKNGFIELRTYTGQYSIGEEMFVDGPPGTIGPDGKPTETVSEENYFFKLSEFQRPLIDLIESNQLLIQPESRKNEVLSFLRGNIANAQPATQSPGAPFMAQSHRDMSGNVEPSQATASPTANTTPATSENSAVILSERSESKDPESADPANTSQTISATNIQHSAKGTPYAPGALKDLSISRSSFKWGIPVPGDEKHVIYVWLDALANYMTAIGYGAEDRTDISEEEKKKEKEKFDHYWPADLHLVGKEIIRFHCVYWPAFLMAMKPADKTQEEWNRQILPKQITAHGWLLFEDSKMSKSRGNIVRTETILDAFGTLCPATPATTSQTAVILSERSESKDPEGLNPTQAASTLPAPESVLLKGTASTTSKEPEAESLVKGTPSTTSKEPEAEGLVKGTASATSKEPEAEGLVKGTASAVPQNPSAGAALAAEVRLPSAEEWKHEQDLFAADVLRYFLLREIPFGQDGSFSFDALVQRYNSDLANGYGNLVSRTLTMIENFLQGEPCKHSSFKYLVFPIGSRLLEETLLFDPADLTKTVTTILSYVASLDGYLSEKAPWKLAKKDDEQSRYDLEEVLFGVAESIRIITALLHPVLPYATAKVWAQLGLGDIEQAAKNGDLKDLQWGGLKPGTKLGPLSPIFPRAPKELIQLMTDMEQDAAPKPEPSKLLDEKTAAPPIPADPTHPAAPPRTSSFAEPNPGAQVGGAAAPHPDLVKTPPHTEAPASGAFATAAAASTTPDTPQIAIDDFVKIDLRVAQIVVAERIPKADKLLRLEVDLGYERRQILSGIAQWYTPEELIGRKIVVIANLAPRKMRGLESHGMLLAASHGEDGKPVLATFGEDVPLGSRLK